MYIKLRQICILGLLGLLLVAFSGRALSSTPQEDVLELMVDLQTNKNPISLAKYERMSRSERIETRVYLEDAISGLDGKERERLLIMFDERIGGVGGNQGIVGGLHADGLSLTAGALPSVEQKYLRALVRGDEDAVELRAALIGAKALLYSSQGVESRQAARMAQTYLTLSTESIAIGAGVDPGSLGGVIKKSLSNQGTPIDTALKVSNELVSLASRPLADVEMLPKTKGIVIDNPIIEDTPLLIRTEGVSFGFDLGLERSEARKPPHGVGAAL